ncbi:MAG TPA: hypothetical protein VFS42_03590 [Burkholderiaceae bacterium]|nr:hypothetical protein [Burkholderiaceae bacterium]
MSADANPPVRPLSPLPYSETLAMFARYLHVNEAAAWTQEGLQENVDTRHPNTRKVTQVFTPRDVRIDETTAERLKLARLTIDLVRVLLPFGTGNQFKQLYKLGAEPLVRARYLRSELRNDTRSLSLLSLRDREHLRARCAIKWQAGQCSEFAAVAFFVLASLPELRNARIDMVDCKDADHNMVVIRGNTPEQDIVVDPWVLYPIPSLVTDAANEYQPVATRSKSIESYSVNGGLMLTKPSGEQWTDLNIDAAIESRDVGLSSAFDIRMANEPMATREGYASYSGRTIQTNLQERFLYDVMFNGNPNVTFIRAGGKRSHATFTHPPAINQPLNRNAQVASDNESELTRVAGRSSPTTSTGSFPPRTRVFL